jgi:hypothetical protein
MLDLFERLASTSSSRIVNWHIKLERQAMHKQNIIKANAQRRQANIPAGAKPLELLVGIKQF